MAKFSFVLGAAAGYVLGARAGKERYAQIQKLAGRAWGSPAVQSKVEDAKVAAKTKAAPAAKSALSGAASAAGSTVAAAAGKATGGSTPDEVWATEPATNLEPNEIHVQSSNNEAQGPGNINA
ncbi:protoporphyrinogen oxidase [Janibacter massiliensis]|uniref:protoporphyrinogen oxidase n=1 Tax=Janibacter massiliensis TaxID=2058291 RepID=UPI0018FEBDC9|nr:protoporphyrinogen oxidase [Janibacter massiliensis]